MNLLKHTVNNVIQQLKQVKRTQYSVVKLTFNNIHIMCEIFRTISWVLCKIQLLNLKGSKLKVAKVEFRLKSAFW